MTATPTPTNAVAIANGNQQQSMPIVPPTSIELALVQGDLSQLEPQERLLYYQQVCQSLGLNPLTRPFDYVRLNGKLCLYARKDCTEQLRKRDNVTVEIVSQNVTDNILTVHVRASLPAGANGEVIRSDEDFGTVSLLHSKTGEPLAGEERANAFMRAVTKAKRRVTLSVCGLGFLDELEVADVPGVVAGNVAANESRQSAPALQAPVASPSPIITEGQLAEIVRLRTELQIDGETWKNVILAKRGVTTAKDLGQAAAQELIEKLRHRVSTSQLQETLPARDAAQPNLTIALPPGKYQQETGGAAAAPPAEFQRQA